METSAIHIQLEPITAIRCFAILAAGLHELREVAKWEGLTPYDELKPLRNAADQKPLHASSHHGRK
jgi:hypothetical protein